MQRADLHPREYAPPLLVGRAIAHSEMRQRYFDDTRNERFAGMMDHQGPRDQFQDLRAYVPEPISFRDHVSDRNDDQSIADTAIGEFSLANQSHHRRAGSSLTFEPLLQAARIRRLIRDDLIQVSGRTRRKLEGTKAARRRERFSKVVSVASRPLADM